MSTMTQPARNFFTIFRADYQNQFGSRYRRPGIFARFLAFLPKLIPNGEQGSGPSAAGQSGGLQGLSNVADADSENVEQLVAEGQAIEADAIAGVEDAPDADSSEVHTRQRRS